ncbi:MAG TPA: outer membrane lipoprotein-sorting protein [Bacteroidales bacterium]|nr:outer membrane lipoprotein-sorting protein [Bacteroidales bacterium]
MYKIAVLLVITLTGSVTQPDPAEIVKKSHDAVKVDSYEAVSTLTITDNRNNTRVRKSSMASKVFPDGTEKRIIKFLSPAEVEGTGILIFDHEEKADDMWIYLPALRKTRRIISREKSSSFMGSEFSNSDMTAPAMSEFRYKLNGSETLNEKACYKITSTPLNIDIEEEYGYSKRIQWIEKNNYLVQKSEYYDISGELLKTIRMDSYKIVEGSNKMMVTDMYAENHQNGRSSRMKMDKVQITDTDEYYFTVGYLER